MRPALLVGGVAGPWTDEPTELEGWDVERFVEIATAPGRPWVDSPVEYPPGSFVLFELIAGHGDVALTNDLVAVLAFAADLVTMWILIRVWGRRSATVHLLIGALLAPLAYQRLDVVAATLAVAALASAVRGRAVGPGLFISAGAAVKLFPAVLVPALVLAAPPHRRRSVLGSAVACGLAVLAAWIGVGGLDAIGQVLTYRGAEGIHVESVLGQLTLLIDGGEPIREAGSFRVPGRVTGLAGPLRGVGLVCIVLVWLRAARGVGGLRSAWADGVDRICVGLASVGTLALLLLTSSLFSPQFLLWLVPFAGISWAEGDGRPAALLLAAVLATQAAHLGWHPSGVHHTPAQILLAMRHGALAAIAVLALNGSPKPACGRHAVNVEPPT